MQHDGQSSDMEYGGEVQPDYNWNIDTSSLSRSLSAPRRCSYCQKIMFFKTYRCKHCRYRCHKKCAGHSHGKSRGCHRSLSGEEHWTKVLQANEVNSNLVVVPCHLSARSTITYTAPHTLPTDGATGCGGGRGSSGGGVSGNRSKTRHASAATMTTTTATPTPTAAPSPKCAKSFSSVYHPSSGASNAKESGSSSPTVKDASSNLFTSLYERLCRWVNTAGGAGRRPGGGTGGGGSDSRGGSRSRTPRTPRSLSRSSSAASSKSQDLYQLLPNMSEDQYDELSVTHHHSHHHHHPHHSHHHHHHHHNQCIHTTSVSSEESDVGSFRQASYSSTCSSLTIMSSSTTCSGDWPAQASNTDSFPPSAISTGYFNPASAAAGTGGATTAATAATGSARHRSHRTQFLSVGSKGLMPHSNLTFTISCPLRTKRQSISANADPRDRSSLCATWPPSSRKTYADDEDEEEVTDQVDRGLFDDEVLEDAVFGDPDEPKSWEQREAELRESLREFSISWKDLEFGECLRVGRSTQIYKGKWHGEVMIHTYPNVRESEVIRFWEEVSKLSMIRHENVALFMGASIEPPHLAVITSVRRGASLYEQVHITKEKMSLHKRVHIVRQIAQGMGYLHAKGVVMSKLNSKNIYLEPKVKLCLVDYSMAEEKFKRPYYGYVPKGHLTYVAPEVLRTLAVVAPRLVPMAPYTKETDVFAFGTVMFELMTGQFPFRRMPSEVLVWQVCRGYRHSLKHLKYSASLKSVIAQCWAQEPSDRPTLSDINKHFQFNGALHKRHSSSEPERLNNSGLTSKTTLL